MAAAFPSYGFAYPQDPDSGTTTSTNTYLPIPRRGDFIVYGYDTAYFEPPPTQKLVIDPRAARQAELRRWTRAAIELRRRLERAETPRRPRDRAAPAARKHPTNSAERYRVTP